MRYYLLRDDIEFPNRWYLGDVHHVDNWLFSDPPNEFMEPCTYTIDIYRDGSEMDYTVSETYNVPIVSEKFKSAISGIEEVDKPYHHVVIEPVNIKDRDLNEKYYVMIIETKIDCVDEEKSNFEKFTLDDPVRPDLAGNYNGFFNLVINPQKAKGFHIFRIKNHINSIIVSEYIKKKLEKSGITGAIFDSVNGDTTTIA